MSRTAAAALTAACLLAVPVAAQAAGWTMLGGDPGHSGRQTADPPALPATGAWFKADGAAPRTGAILTGGESAADRRVAYGSSGAEARVHIRRQADGTDTVPGGVAVVSDDADALGDGREAVTPVASSAERPGQLYVVHNDDDAGASYAAPACFIFPGTAASQNDLSIAQYDVATGQRVRDVAIGQPRGNSLCSTNEQLTDGYTIDSSPVLSPPLDSTGARALFFVARRDAGGPGRLFRVDIPDPDATDSGIEVVAPAFRDVEDLNTQASPTLALLRDPESGETRLFVAVSRTSADGSDIVAYRASDLDSDVVVDVEPGIPGNPQTVTAPVGEDGALTSPAAALYAAYNDGDKVRVRAFVQDGKSGRLGEPLAPAVLDGDPGPGLAAGPEGLYVPTSEGLARVNAGTLAVEASGRGGAFARSVPVAAGELVFAVADDGSHVVLDSALDPVAGEDFAETPENADATSAVGQPAYAATALAFLSDRGAALYRTAIAEPPPPGGGGSGGGNGGGTPPPANEPPTASFIFAPNPGKAGQLVGFDASASRDADGKIARYQWDLDGNGSFETDGGAKPGMLGIYPAGVHNVRLRVTDDDGATGDTVRQLTVVGEAVKAQRVRPRRFLVTVSPTRDRTAPYRFTVRGRITLPAGVNRTAGCTGEASISVKAGKRTIMRRTGRLTRECTFSRRVSFRNRKRIGRSRKLRFVVRFRGNRELLGRRAPTRKVRVG